MKKSIIFTLAYLSVFTLLAQEGLIQKNIPFRPPFSIKKNIAAKDTLWEVVEMPVDTLAILDGKAILDINFWRKYHTDSLVLSQFILRKNNLYLRIAESKRPKPYTYQSLPENAGLLLEDVWFEDKRILQFLDPTSYTIPCLLSLLGAKYLFQKNTAVAYCYLKNREVPQDFFLVTPHTLESVRYRWAGVAKVFDYLGIPTDENSKDPAFILDGRVQPQEFDWILLKPADFQPLEILSPTNAERFYGKKAKNGLVIFRTKSYKPNDRLAHQNIRVIAEKHKKDGSWAGKWETVSDTVVNNLAAFENYHKHILRENGPIYMIDNKPETEEINRANIELDKVESIYVKMGKRVEINDSPIIATKLFQLRNSNQKRAMLDSSFKALIAMEEPDTVFLKMHKGRNWENTNLPSIVSDLMRMRKTQTETKPLYILNDKEVSLEDLKNYKNSDFEKVTVLEGYDAYKAYGKKGEYGVVVYQLKRK